MAVVHGAFGEQRSERREPQPAAIEASAPQAQLTSLCMLTMQAFRGVLPWDGACIYQVNADGEAFGHRLYQMPPEQLSLYRKHLTGHDPLSPARFCDGGINVVPLEDAQRDFDSRVYVETFLEAYNMPYEVELFFRDLRDRIVAGMALFRTQQSGRFRLREIELLDRVRPLAEAGFRLLLRPAQPAGEALADYGLTPREAEVIAQVRRGGSNEEIARLLNIKVATVKTHLVNAFGKTGVSSRTELLSRLYLDG